MQSESSARRLNGSGGDASARIRSFQAYQAQRQRAGVADNRNSFEQFRRGRSGNDDTAGGSTPQLRTFRDRSSSDNQGQGITRNRATTGRLDSDQLRAVLNQRGNRSSDDAQADANRARQSGQRNWNARRIDPNATGRNDGVADGSNVRGKGNRQAVEEWLRNRGRSNGPNDFGDQANDFRRNGSRSGDDGNARRRAGRGDLSGNEAARRSRQEQFRRRNGNDGDRDFAHRGRWSRNSDEIGERTQRWFRNSGFGDHRDRSDRRRRGDFDDDFADNVRNHWRNHWNRNWRGDDDGHRHHRHLPFAFSWWSGYDRSPFHVYWRDDRWRRDPYYWWHSCTAPRLTSWISFGWYEPCYWDYGPGEYVYYRDNYVYVDGQPYGTALEYYAQIRALAQGVPALSQEQWAGIDWLSLGVFAVTRQGSESQELIQLAVSPDGILSGTLFNQQTGTARPLKGMVDQATQRAAWVLADAPAEALVVETSLFNLTEPECTALAHLDPVTTEVWRLVKLEQPAAEPAPAAGAPALPAPGF